MTEPQTSPERERVFEDDDDVQGHKLTAMATEDLRSPDSGDQDSEGHARTA